MNLDILSNFKKVIFDILKNPELQSGKLGSIAMALAPMLMVALNGNLAIEFDSFDELKELPMLQPLLANFAQLFEGVTGSDVETMLSDRIQMEEGVEIKSYLKLMIEFMHTIFDICEKMAGEIELNFTFPKVAGVKLNITSEDLGKVILLLVRATMYEKKVKPKYEWTIAAQ